MYRTGHYGAALLAFAPLALGLVFLGHPGLAVLGGGLSLALAPVPDYDQRVPFVSHRGVTHTLLFALLTGGVLGVAGWSVGSAAGTASAARLATFGAVVGTTSCLSHLLADAITPAGIAPFWPLSKKNYTLGLVRADNVLANYLLFALGVSASVCIAVVADPSMVAALG